MENEIYQTRIYFIAIVVKLSLKRLTYKKQTFLWVYQHYNTKLVLDYSILKYVVLNDYYMCNEKILTR